jgi:hypothetical protein
MLLIFLILVMLAAERRAEMGMSRAVGMKRRQLIEAIMAEGMAYSLVEHGVLPPLSRAPSRPASRGRDRARRHRPAHCCRTPATDKADARYRLHARERRPLIRARVCLRGGPWHRERHLAALLLANRLLASEDFETAGLETFHVPWLQITLMATGVFAASVLTTVLPSRQAAGIPPAEALWYE